MIRKEFCLEIWDYAKLLLPEPGPAARLTGYLELLCQQAPKSCALHILALNRAPAIEAVPWEKLLELPDLRQLTLQVSSLHEYAGALATLGPRLEKVTIIEMVGDRENGTLVEGLDLGEQGALYVCEKCPNAVSLDLVTVNISMKFFFGRRIVTQPNHFHQLRELSIGKVDWETLKQVWSLVPVLAKLAITTLVPMFTLSEQMYEEPLVLTITQATELIKLNSRILHNLEILEVTTFRFATFSALSFFVSEFSDQLVKIGNIDADCFNQAEREDLERLVKRLGDRGTQMKCCDVFHLY